MIKKIGIDIVANARIKALLNDETFCKRILSSLEEKKFCEITSDKRKTEYLAGRFAARKLLSKLCPKDTVLNIIGTSMFLTTMTVLPLSG